MREIKFRAYNKQIGWYWSHPEPDDSEARLDCNSLSGFFRFICEPKPEDADGFHMKDDYGVIEEGWRLMQYTGLKDKNGKEIYEGDIVRHSIGYPDEDICVVGDLEDYFRTDEIQTERYGISLHGPVAEVVGNIHENPNLLDEKFPSKKD